MPRFRSTLPILTLLCAALAACNKDQPTGPTVTFPALPSAILTNFCVRGDRQPPQDSVITGTVDDTDCALGDGSWYEMWRVRVPKSGAYQFAAQSAFDNYIAVLLLQSYTDSTATLSSIGEDDNSGGGTNARVAVSLTAGIDYFLVVNGFDSTDTGPYTVRFTGP